jgi:hypothetical protein
VSASSRNAVQAKTKPEKRSGSPLLEACSMITMSYGLHKTRKRHTGRS